MAKLGDVFRWKVKALGYTNSFQHRIKRDFVTSDDGKMLRRVPRMIASCGVLARALAHDGFPTLFPMRCLA
jgi:hypothetical protein